MELRIPKLGTSMTEGTLTEWLVADGAAVAAGEELYTVETDKVESSIEAPVAGTLHHQAAVGETHPVGALVGWIQT